MAHFYKKTLLASPPLYTKTIYNTASIKLIGSVFVLSILEDQDSIPRRSKNLFDPSTTYLLYFEEERKISTNGQFY